MTASNLMQDHLIGLEEPTRPKVSAVEALTRAANKIRARKEEEEKRKREREKSVSIEPEPEPDLDESSQHLEELAAAEDARASSSLPGAAEDNEPAGYEEVIKLVDKATSHEARDLSFLNDMGLACDTHEAQAVWQTILAHRAVVSCCGSAAAVRQALFSAISSVSIVEAQAAYEELASCLSADTVDNGHWVPSMPQLWQCLLDLGYEEPGSHNTTLREGHHGGEPQEFENSESCRSLHSLKLILNLMLHLCQLNKAGIINWDFREHQVITRRVLLALHRMCLDPAVISAMLYELSRVRELLVEAWASADDCSWRAAEQKLAEELSETGPSHRASLRILTCRAGCSTAATQLSQRAALALIARLLKRKVSLPSSDRCKDRSFADHLQELMGPPDQVPTVIKAMQQDQPQHQHDLNDGIIDYWKLRTLIQAADAVMWPLQVSGELPDASWRWWCGQLRVLDERLSKDRDAAGVRSIVATIKNNHEFMRM